MNERGFRPRIVVDNERQPNNGGAYEVESKLLKQADNLSQFDNYLAGLSQRMESADYKTMCGRMAEQARSYYNDVQYGNGKMEVPDLLPNFLSSLQPEAILQFASKLNAEATNQQGGQLRQMANM